MIKTNNILLLFAVFATLLSGCSIRQDIYVYRAHSTISKDDINKNYNITIENDQDNKIGNILSENGLDLSQKPNAKKLLVKLFFHEIDNINVSPYNLRKTLNFKIIGFDSITKLAVFEVFTKLTTCRIEQENSIYLGRGKKSNFYKRKIYYNRYPYTISSIINNPREFAKDQTYFLIKTAIKLIGENVYIDNVSESFDIDEFLKKNKK